MSGIFLCRCRRGFAVAVEHSKIIQMAYKNHKRLIKVQNDITEINHLIAETYAICINYNKQ